MNKRLKRLIALLLVFCLVADPATAAAWGAFATRRPAPAAAPSLFAEQALTAYLTQHRRPSFGESAHRIDKETGQARDPLQTKPDSASSAPLARSFRGSVRTTALLVLALAVGALTSPAEANPIIAAMNPPAIAGAIAAGAAQSGLGTIVVPMAQALQAQESPLAPQAVQERIKTLAEQLLTHPEARMRIAAARELGRISDPAAIDSLIQGISDPEGRRQYSTHLEFGVKVVKGGRDAGVVSWAMEGLIKIGDPAADAVLGELNQQLADPTPSLVGLHNIAVILGEVGRPNAIPSLQTLLQFEDPELSSVATKAIDMIQARALPKALSWIVWLATLGLFPTILMAASRRSRMPKTKTMSPPAKKENRPKDLGQLGREKLERLNSATLFDLVLLQLHPTVAKKILTAKGHKPFKDLQDLSSRLQGQGLNRAEISSIVVLLQQSEIPIAHTAVLDYVRDKSVNFSETAVLLLLEGVKATPDDLLLMARAIAQAIQEEKTVDEILELPELQAKGSAFRFARNLEWKARRFLDQFRFDLHMALARYNLTAEDFDVAAGYAAEARDAARFFDLQDPDNQKRIKDLEQLMGDIDSARFLHRPSANPIGQTMGSGPRRGVRGGTEAIEPKVIDYLERQTRLSRDKVQQVLGELKVSKANQYGVWLRQIYDLSRSNGGMPLSRMPRDNGLIAALRALQDKKTSSPSPSAPRDVQKERRMILAEIQALLKKIPAPPGETRPVITDQQLAHALDNRIDLSNTLQVVSIPRSVKREIGPLLERLEKRWPTILSPAEFASLTPHDHLARARQMSGAKRYGEAIAAYQQVLKEAPRYDFEIRHIAMLELANAYRLSEDYDAALAVLAQLLEALHGRTVNPLEPLVNDRFEHDALYLQAECEAALGHVDLAIHDYLQSLKLLENRRKAIAGSTSLRDDPKKTAAALAEHDQLILSRSCSLARVYMKQKQWTLAKAALKRAQAVDPENPVYLDARLSFANLYVYALLTADPRSLERDLQEIEHLLLEAVALSQALRLRIETSPPSAQKDALLKRFLEDEISARADLTFQVLEPQHRYAEVEQQVRSILAISQDEELKQQCRNALAWGAYYQEDLWGAWKALHLEVNHLPVDYQPVLLEKDNLNLWTLDTMIRLRLAQHQGQQNVEAQEVDRKHPLPSDPVSRGLEIRWRREAAFSDALGPAGTALWRLAEMERGGEAGAAPALRPSPYDRIRQGLDKLRFSREKLGKPDQDIAELLMVVGEIAVEARWLDLAQEAFDLAVEFYDSPQTRLYAESIPALWLKDDRSRDEKKTARERYDSHRFLFLEKRETPSWVSESQTALQDLGENPTVPQLEKFLTDLRARTLFFEDFQLDPDPSIARAALAGRLNQARLRSEWLDHFETDLEAFGDQADSIRALVWDVYKIKLGNGHLGVDLVDWLGSIPPDQREVYVKALSLDKRQNPLISLVEAWLSLYLTSVSFILPPKARNKLASVAVTRDCALTVLEQIVLRMRKAKLQNVAASEAAGEIADAIHSDRTDVEVMAEVDKILGLPQTAGSAKERTGEPATEPQNVSPKRPLADSPARPPNLSPVAASDVARAAGNGSSSGAVDVVILACVAALAGVLRFALGDDSGAAGVMAAGLIPWKSLRPVVIWIQRQFEDPLAELGRGQESDTQGPAAHLGAETVQRMWVELSKLSPPAGSQGRGPLEDALRRDSGQDDEDHAEFKSKIENRKHILNTLMAFLSVEVVCESLAHQFTRAGHAVRLLSDQIKGQLSLRKPGASYFISPALARTLDLHCGPSAKALGKALLQEVWLKDPISTAKLLMTLSTTGEEHSFQSVVSVLGIERLRQALLRSPSICAQTIERLMSHPHRSGQWAEWWRTQTSFPMPLPFGAWEYLAHKDVFGPKVLQDSFDQHPVELGILVIEIERLPAAFEALVQGLHDSKHPSDPLWRLKGLVSSNPGVLIPLLRVLSDPKSQRAFAHLIRRWGPVDIADSLETSPSELIRELEHARKEEKFSFIDSLRHKIHKRVFRSLHKNLTDLQKSFMPERWKSEEFKKKATDEIERWVKEHPFGVNYILPRVLRRRLRGQTYQWTFLGGDSAVLIYAQEWAPGSSVLAPPTQYTDHMNAVIPLEHGLTLKRYIIHRAPEVGAQALSSSRHKEVVDLTLADTRQPEKDRVQWLSTKTNEVEQIVNNAGSRVFVLNIVFYGYPLVTTFIPEGSQPDRNQVRCIARRHVADDPTLPIGEALIGERGTVKLKKDQVAKLRRTLEASLEGNVDMPEIYTAEGTALITPIEALDYMDQHRLTIYRTRDHAYVFKSSGFAASQGGASGTPLSPKPSKTSPPADASPSPSLLRRLAAAA